MTPLICIKANYKNIRMHIVYTVQNEQYDNKTFTAVSKNIS